jgi:hypothetical protein
MQKLVSRTVAGSDREIDLARWRKKQDAMSIWRNPTAVRVRFELQVTEPRLNTNWAPGKTDCQPMHHAQFLIIDLAPGEQVEVPTEHDLAIQFPKCQEGCTPRKGQMCSNPKVHRQMIVGGFGVMLQRIGDNGEALEVNVHPGLQPMPTPFSASEVDEMHRRTMERVGAQKGAIR